MTNAINWLQNIAGQSTIINNGTDCFQINSNYQLQILQAGRYRVQITMTNTTTSNDFQLYTSGIGTSGFTQYHISTQVNAATYSFTLDTEILVEIGVNNFWQL